MKLFYRQNGMFKIDDKQLKPKLRTPKILNALYAAVYDEFRGAENNPKYSNLNYLERINKLNEFAENWLKEKRLI